MLCFAPRGEDSPWADVGEVSLARRELEIRDERIKKLEESMQQQAEVQRLMEEDARTMEQQLNEARALLAKHAVQQEKRRQKWAIESAAAQEMEQQEQQRRNAAQEAEKRRKAAAERKAAVDRERAAGREKKSQARRVPMRISTTSLRQEGGLDANKIR